MRCANETLAEIRTLIYRLTQRPHLGARGAPGLLLRLLSKVDRLGPSEQMIVAHMLLESFTEAQLLLLVRHGGTKYPRSIGFQKHFEAKGHQIGRLIPCPKCNRDKTWVFPKVKEAVCLRCKHCWIPVTKCPKCRHPFYSRSTKDWGLTWVCRKCFYGWYHWPVLTSGTGTKTSIVLSEVVTTSSNTVIKLGEVATTSPSSGETWSVPKGDYPS